MFISLIETLLRCGAVGSFKHATAPEVHIRQKGADAVSRKASFRVTQGGISILCGRIAAFEVVNQAFQNLCARSCSNAAFECFFICMYGRRNKRHIAIGTYQVEIVKRTKGQHFCFHGTPVRNTETGVSTVVNHLLAFFNHEVAIIDAGIEISPTEHSVCGLQHAVLHIHNISVLQFIEFKVVASELAPIENAARDAALRHLLISAGAHALEVILIFPEVFFGNLVGRKDGQEVLARREACCGNNQPACQQ